MSGAIREVLLGADPDDVRLSRRAQAALIAAREEHDHTVDPEVLILERQGDRHVWWTYAGGAANNSIAAAISELGCDADHDSVSVRWTSGEALDVAAVAEALARPDPPIPVIDPKAIQGLKFAEVLPPEVAIRTLTERFTDPAAGRRTARRAVRLRAVSES